MRAPGVKCAPPQRVGRSASRTVRRRVRNSPSLRLAVLVAALSASAALPATAQVKASEPASVSQTVDGTKLTIEYSRPRARDRDTLFGKVVPWGEVWTPGANLATTLEVGNDVSVDGHPVPKGKYSVWMQVEPGDWTMVLDPKHEAFHTQHPKEDSTQIRWTFTPGSAAFTDVLTWEFDRIGIDGATLVMRWGTVRVPLEVKVPRSWDLAFEGAKAGPYLGAWTIKSEPGMGDTAITRITIAHQDGQLVGTLEPPLFGAAEYRHMVLMPKREDWFTPVFMVDGEVYEMWDEVLVEFERKDGRAVVLAMRGLKDEVYARGRRTD